MAKKEYEIDALMAPNRFGIKDGSFFKWYDAPEKVIEPNGAIDFSKMPNIREINKETFYRESGLESVNLGNIAKIGSMAFASTSIENVHIPKYVSKIDGYAFANCKELDKVIIGSQKEPNIFQKLLKKEVVEEFNYETSLEQIPYECFAGSDISEIIIGKGVKKIDPCAFLGCNKLQHVICDAELKPELNAALKNAGIEKTVLVATTPVEYEANIKLINDMNTSTANIMRISDKHNKEHVWTVPKLIDEGYAKIENGQFAMIKNLPGNNNSVFIQTKLEDAKYQFDSFSNNAFVNQDSISRIDIDQHVFISPDAFKGCINLDHLNIDRLSKDYTDLCLNMAHKENNHESEIQRIKTNTADSELSA